MLSCSTGASASGYIAMRGTHAPWSSPRPGCWCTGSLSGIAAVTRRDSAVASEWAQSNSCRSHGPSSNSGGAPWLRYRAGNAPSSGVQAR